MVYDQLTGARGVLGRTRRDDPHRVADRRSVGSFPRWHSL